MPVTAPGRAGVRGCVRAGRPDAQPGSRRPRERADTWPRGVRRACKRSAVGRDDTRRPKRRAAPTPSLHGEETGPSAAVAPRRGGAPRRSPRPRPPGAAAIVALRAGGKSVLRAVTATAAAAGQRWRPDLAGVAHEEPITNEANSIVSAPKKTRSARWHCRAAGLSAGSGERQSPPSRGERGGGEAPGWVSWAARARSGHRVTPDSDQERAIASGCHHEEEAAARDGPRRSSGSGRWRS